MLAFLAVGAGALLVGCGGGEGSADAGLSQDAAPIDGPFEYRVVVSSSDARDAGISLTVNGEPAPEFPLVSASFATYAEAKSAEFAIESWYGETKLFRRVDSPGLCEGGSLCGYMGETPDSESVGLLLEPSGELRIVYITCQPGTHCDLWEMRCDPMHPQSSCEEGSQCGLVVAVSDPLYAHFDCVPAGETPLGEACTRGAPGLETGYDDCTGGAVCWGGVCRAVCTPYEGCADDEPCELLPRNDRMGTCADPAAR